MLRDFENRKEMYCSYCGVMTSFVFNNSLSIQLTEFRVAECPRCYNVVAEGRENKTDLKRHPIGAGHTIEKEVGTWSTCWPSKKTICVHEEIPVEIRKDINNAYSIVDITPEAAARLIIRALEIILKKYVLDTKGDKKLYELITESKKQIPTIIFTLLKPCRLLGNMGGHCIEDRITGELLGVKVEEAVAMIKVVNDLAEEWFVNRIAREQMDKQIEAKYARSKKS